MNTYTLYRAEAPRGYRGHRPGATFTARLAAGIEARAVARGNITVLERLIPALPVNRKLPAGWATNEGDE